MLLQRRPTPALAPFVECFWYSEVRAGAAARERALPTGSASLVFRLSDAPVRLFADIDDLVGTTFGHAVLGGVRSSAYLRDTSTPASSIGVQFRPGGAAAVLGVPADELAERHLRLDDLWRAAAGEARERLLETPEPEARLALLDELLCARLTPGARVHPAVRAALVLLDADPGRASIATIVGRSGYSHRHLAELFRGAVGLTPKVYGRIRRFQRVVARAATAARSGPSRAGSTGASWADLALACGYHDQSHLVREFQALAGFSPGRYAPLSADRPNHVPVVEPPRRSISSKTRAAPRA